MDTTTLSLDAAEKILADFDFPMHRPEDFRLDIIVPPARLLDVIRQILDHQWGYLSTITGLDHPGEERHIADDRQWRQQHEEEPTSDQEREGSIEVQYHFCHGAAVLTLRTQVSYTNPSLPTVTNLIPSAGLYERELSEMFGVHIRGNPSTKGHLLLPEDWPKDVYPLRKSFNGLKEEGKS